MFFLLLGSMLGNSPIQTMPQMELFCPLLDSFINLDNEVDLLC
jgi:hypothetical protein